MAQNNQQGEQILFYFAVFNPAAALFWLFSVFQEVVELYKEFIKHLKMSEMFHQVIF